MSDQPFSMHYPDVFKHDKPTCITIDKTAVRTVSAVSSLLVIVSERQMHGYAMSPLATLPAIPLSHTADKPKVYRPCVVNRD
ncbi:MAG: hypothetical protein K2X93_27450 [Candidatus Obscuribacterales bacterium]|nr:hypothetical protein [Candidatus Obscuribacterales bacterium]